MSCYNQSLFIKMLHLFLEIFSENIVKKKKILLPNIPSRARLDGLLLLLFSPYTLYTRILRMTHTVTLISLADRTLLSWRAVQYEYADTY